MNPEPGPSLSSSLIKSVDIRRTCFSLAAAARRWLGAGQGYRISYVGYFVVGPDAVAQSDDRGMDEGMEGWMDRGMDGWVEGGREGEGGRGGSKGGREGGRERATGEGGRGRDSKVGINR